MKKKNFFFSFIHVNYFFFFFPPFKIQSTSPNNRCTFSKRYMSCRYFYIFICKCIFIYMYIYILYMIYMYKRDRCQEKVTCESVCTRLVCFVAFMSKLYLRNGTAMSAIYMYIYMYKYSCMYVWMYVLN